MGTSDCPSPYSLDIYYASEVQQALSDDPDITLFDFLLGWSEKEGRRKEYQHRKEPVEYWYCTECRRVYEVQAVARGRWLRIYKMVDSGEVIDYAGWTQIYVMPDTETDAATEENFGITLAEYVKQHDAVNYYLSPDETTAVGVRKEQSMQLLRYKLEEKWSKTE